MVMLRINVDDGLNFDEVDVIRPVRDRAEAHVVLDQVLDAMKYPLTNNENDRRGLPR